MIARATGSPWRSPPLDDQLRNTHVDVRLQMRTSPHARAQARTDHDRPLADAGRLRCSRHGGTGDGQTRTSADLLSGDADDPRLSRSLLRGFSLLFGFGPDGGERGIVELANDLGMSPSTAHRYALTLVELGLLERCPRTRKYRLPAV
jgi:IclR helix-turn-helix domain